ncbi:MAG: UDP-N-acetylglucosamine 1-carboxyvinyltransferase [Candidatus Cloacimonetes bacterium]|nr:UDP-N-acetylglucosamine 1-carboxyvinyltransferase [Candidatus Cloacimonadota bacterium]
MEKLIIEGGKKLSNEIKVSGAKNAVLPLMASSLLTGGVCKIYNVPVLNDIKMMAHLMRIIGSRVDFENSVLTIDSSHCSYYEAPYELVSKMRASIYVLSPLLARFGQAKVSLPGGCAIGARPIDLHLMALEKMGAEIKIEHGYINASVKRLKGCDILFDKASVGATVTVLLAAVKSDGITKITNAALEPEIGAVIDFLQAMGADISGKGTTELTVKGVEKLSPAETTVIPDRIEAGTFLIAGAITKSDVKIVRLAPEHLGALLEKLEQTGCNIEKGEDWIRLVMEKHPLPVDIITKPYPGFPTDLQAQFTSLMCLAEGTSIVEETIFSERYHHIPELNRLDADITLEGNKAYIKGVSQLSGAEVMATDLRASAALVLAGLAAQGETTISRVYHLDRGYEKMEHKLNKAGASIKRFNI